jgi:hypothetical protein
MGELFNQIAIIYNNYFSQLQSGLLKCLTTAKIQLQGSTEENKKFWEELIAYFP